MWYNKYVGIPYKDNGRNWDGVDCWGLVRLVYKDKYGVDLPSFAEEYYGANDTSITSELIARNKENWQLVSDKIEGSVILFKILGTATHVGIYIGGNKFLHAKEGHSSVIESLDSINWNKRVVGFFRYSEASSIIVNAVPHAFKTQKYIEIVQEGSQLKNVIDAINHKYKVSDRLKSKLIVLLNGKIATEGDFNKYLTKFDTVEYRVVPEGSNPLRSILMIAVMVAAVMAGQWYVMQGMEAAAAASAAAGEVASTVIPASLSYAGAAVTMGVNMVGMALVDAIAPVRMPKQNENNPGSPVALNLFSGGSNAVTKYGPIPVVLGRMRMTPPVAGATLLVPETYTSYLNMSLCWGFGPLSVDESTVMVGGVSLKEYVGSDGHYPDIVTIDDTPQGSSDSEKERYRRIYSSDIKQVFPNAELSADHAVGIPGPWREEILEDESTELSKKINKFTVTLTFPEGLRKVYTAGNSAGESESSTATFAIEYALKNPTTLEYESWEGVGTTYSTSAMGAQELLLPRPMSVDNDTGNGTYGYAWFRLGTVNNRLILIRGKYSDRYKQEPSVALQAAIDSGNYSSLLGTNGSTDTFPAFGEGVIPLVSLYVSGESGIINTGDVINHSIDSAYTKTGLNITWENTTIYDEWYVSTTFAGVKVNITAGSISTAGSSGNIISITQNRKDAFNYTSKEIVLKTPGDYKVRVRRLNEATTEVNNSITPTAALTNSYNIVPTTNSLVYTATSIMVRQGLDFLEFTESEELSKNQWRIVSVVGTNVTPGSKTVSGDGRVVNYSDITSFTSTTGTITFNLEILSGDGTTFTPSLIQTFTKSTTNSDIYSIYSERTIMHPIADLFAIRFYKNGQYIEPNTLYYTLTEQSEAEGTPKLITKGDGILVGLGQENESFNENLWQGTSPSYGSLYQYKVRLYSDNTKSEASLLDERIIYFRSAQSSITPYRNFSKAILYVITGYTTEEAFLAPKVNGQPCKITRSALRFQSSAKINGQVDGINAIVQTVGLDLDHTLADASNPLGKWVVRVTNNPASLFLHVLMHPGNAYRVVASSRAELQTQVDLAKLEEWHTYCRTNGFTYNNVLDSITSVMDILRDIAAAGRASPTLIDGKWSVVIDNVKPVVVQHFSPHNSWGFESTRVIPRLPHAFRSVIRDEQNGYKENEVIVYNTGYNSSNAELFEEISLPGITNAALVRKHLQWNLAQLKHRPERYTLNTDFEYLVCNRGDRVKVVHDVPMWGTGSGRINTISTSGSTKTITLSEDTLLESGKSYVIRIRSSNGSAELGTISGLTETKYYDTLTYTVTQAATVTVSSGDLFLIGESDLQINDLLVLGIEPLDNKNARLILTDYAPALFDENLNSTYPNITNSISVQPPTGLDNSIAGIIPKEVQISSGPESQTQISTSIIKYNITLNVFPPANLPSNITHIEVEYITSDSVFDVSNNVKRKFFDLTDAVLLDDVLSNTEYKIRVRYVSNDKRAGGWAENGSLQYFLHTVQAISYFNDLPDYIDVDLDRANLLITIGRNLPTTSQFSHYEIRVLKDPDSLIEEDFWNYGDDPLNPQYTNIVRAISSSGQFTVNLLNFTVPRIDPNGVMYRIACRSVDINNNKSSSSIIRSYLLTPLT